MDKPTGKIVRLLASRLDKDDCDLFCLDLGFRDVLLDLAERLEWGATWVNESGDRAELTEQQKTKIEQGLQALTMACEIVINNNVTVEPSNLNVNCGGGGSTIPVPLPPDGSPANPVYIPVLPDDPLGESAPDFDPFTQTPPGGYGTWESFQDTRCRTANYIIDNFIDQILKVDEIENQFSFGKSLLEIALVLIALLPGPIADAAAVVVVVRWIKYIIAGIAVFVTELEDVNDVLQLVRDEVEDHKQQLVCILYQATSVEQARALFKAVLSGLVTGAIGGLALSEKARQAVHDIVEPIGDWFVSQIGNYILATEVPEAYQPSIDCSMCVESDLFTQYLMANQIWSNPVPISVGGTVTMPAEQADQYGPYGAWRFSDNLGNPVYVSTEQISIIALDGWLTHNIVQHPAVLQTKKIDGSDGDTLVGLGGDIPTPYLITRNAAGTAYGIIEVTSEVGTDGFTITLGRHF